MRVAIKKLKQPEKQHCPSAEAGASFERAAALPFLMVQHCQLLQIAQKAAGSNCGSGSGCHDRSESSEAEMMCAAAQ